MKTIYTKLLPAVLLLFLTISNVQAHYIKYIHSVVLPPLLPGNDSITICENSGTAKVSVEGADSLADLVPVIISGPKHGAAFVSGKSIDYTPATNYSGRDTVKYIVCDTALIPVCDTDMLFITIDPSPSVLTGAGRTICYGDTISIGGTAIAGYTYLWTPHHGLSSYTVANPKASPADTTEYTLTVTNTATGCTAKDSVLINVKPVPNASILQGDTIDFCQGQSMMLTASNGTRWLWSTGDTTQNITINIPGEYSVAVTYANGCTDYSAPSEVSINPAPPVSAGPDDSICPGDSTIIGTPAVSGITYSWTPAAGLSSTTAAEPSASPSSTTSYIVTATDTSTGCINSDTIIVVVVPPPVANAGPDVTICQGDSATIGTAASPGLMYSWAPSTGLSSTTVAQPIASPTVTTTYVLTVSNGLCSGTDTVVVNVIPGPAATAGPAKSICIGDSTTLGSAPVAGVSYSWTPAAGLSATTMADPVASPSSTTTYTLTATDTVTGCKTVSTTTVTVLPKPVANAGADTTICQGNGAVIGTAAGAGLIYSWKPSTGLNDTTLAQPTASPSVTTTYVVSVSNGACNSTDTVIVNVLPAPVANAGPDQTVCINDSIQIGTPALSGITYSWAPASGLSSTTVAQPMASPTVTTTYVLTVNNGTCTSTDTVVINVTPSPANAGPDMNVCKGDSIMIGTPATGGATYSWTPSTGLSSTTAAQPFANPTTTTTYILTATNGTCTGKDTVVVTVMPLPVANAGSDPSVCRGSSIVIGTPADTGVTYNWAPASGLSSTTTAQPTATPNVTTTYTLTVSNGTCSNSDTVTVKVLPLPVANAGADPTICKGDSIKIGSTAINGITYNWSPSTGLSSNTIAQPVASPTVTTTYTLTVTNDTCTNSDTVTINVIPSPANAGPDKTICYGDFTIIGTPSTPGTTYSWSPTAGLSSSTVAQPTVTPIITTTYVLTATNGSCVGKDTVVVNVNPTPVANAGPSKTICVGASTIIGTSPSAGVTYQWSPSVGLNSTTIAQPTASPTVTTTYTLTASNDSGCFSIDSVMVTVNLVPAAYVGSPQFLCEAGNVTLGGPAVAGHTYLWTPSTGLGSPTASQTTASPTSTTTYTLLETDTATGCSASNEVQVSVNAGGGSIYNAFSPNGDGINDFWYIPLLECYPSNYVSIVNRWGSEVWSTNDYNNTTVRWDGKNNNGTELPDGTYFYSIKYNNSEKHGWVLIKR